MDDFERELRKSFLDEAAQLLTEAEQCFLSLESNPSEVQTIEKIFRLAHSLKGSAGAVGFQEIARFSHSFESLLIKIKNGQVVIDSSIVSLMLKCNDHLVGQVNALREGQTPGSSDELIAEITAVMEGKKAGTSAPAAAAPATPNEEKQIVVPEAATAQAAVQNLAVGEDAVAHPKIQKGHVTAGADESLRVNVSKLESLLNNVGELVILQTVLNQNKIQIQSALVQRTITQLGKITKDLQEISMSLRMVPLKPSFLKMQRIVRDAAKSLNKEIRLDLKGEDTEIDKTLLERLGDPLVHLVRNAVDHGIETAEDRAKSGKPIEGTIRLGASHRGERIVIQLEDDGRGMDPQKLKAKAVEKGLINAGDVLTDQECFDLIFLPGFSMKSEVTDISGRGVGMDVVKTNVEELNGEIQVETVIGSGTIFRILLPLTMAIVDGMVVMAGDQRYIVPVVNVHESLQPEASQVYDLPGIGEVLHLRGENITLYRLNVVLGHHGKLKPATDCIAIIVKDGNKTFAVLVDDVLGQQQVVIKKLGAELKKIRGFIGGAILGDGRAALIVDLTELLYGSNIAA